MKKILVIDGNSIINRAFYGLRILQAANGKYTNAIYGMINMVKRQMDALRPDYAAVAFDLKAPTFRHKLYAEYKAGRRPTPPELISQFPDAKECLEAMGVHVLELAGWEADDIQGTVAEMAKAEPDTHTYVLSGDRDLLQLICPRTTVLLAANKDTEAMDEAAFFARYGIAPSQFVDAKALMGDASDHVPGVPGVGEKTAMKLVALCGSLDGVYEMIKHPENRTPEIARAMTDGLVKKLTEGAESALLSRELVTIARHVPLPMGLDDLAYRGVDNDRLYTLFVSLEFNGFLTKFRLTPPAREEDEGDAPSLCACPDEENAEAPEGPETSEKAEDAPPAGGPPAGPVPVKKVDFFPFSIPVNVAYDPSEIPLREGGTVAICRFSSSWHVFSPEIGEYILDCPDERLAALFVPGRAFVTYDTKALWHRLHAAGVYPDVTPRDVMLSAYLFRGGDGQVSPQSLCLSLLGCSFDEVGEKEAAMLWAMDEVLVPTLREMGCLGLARDVEWPLALLLCQMEETGFALDREGLADFGRELSEECDRLSERITRAAGHPFNLNSPKQLGEVLFGELGLPVKKKTKSGYSTDAETLEALRGAHPIVADILEYRQLFKLYSTYAVGLSQAVDEQGRLHTDFKQAVTATGRLSSAEPNLQNIPVRTRQGERMRRYFVTAPGWVLVDADYSQIELRLLAHLSRDEQMSSAFRQGEDIHARTAAEVAGVSVSEVTPEMRKSAKAINFGLMYGMGAHSLAADLGIPQKEAKAYIEKYFASFPSVGAYLEAAAEAAEELGYTETLFGRRRYIPQLKSSKAVERALGKRLAMNSPVQGTAADVIKMAMLRVAARLAREIPEARIVMQVHDELIAECPADKAEACAAVLSEEMERAVSLSVPLTAEAGVGATWLDAKH